MKSIITLTRKPKNKVETLIWNYPKLWFWMAKMGVNRRSYSFSPLMLNAVGMLNIFDLFRKLEIPIKELDSDYFFLKGITETEKLAQLIAFTISSEKAEEIKDWIYREIKREEITEAFVQLRGWINEYMQLSFRMYGLEVLKDHLEDNQP